MARKRESVELSESDWSVLNQLAQALGLKSWRTLLRKIATMELVVNPATSEAIECAGNYVSRPGLPPQPIENLSMPRGELRIEKDPDAQV